MGVREAPRPFQDSTQDFLPHFEVRPPRRPPVSPETARLGPLFSRAVERQIEASGPVAEGGRQGVHPPPGSVSVVAAAGRIEEGSGTALAAGAFRRELPGLWRWLLWSRCLGFRLKPRAARRPAQGELSLATVQVKRNDLLDADLELVWNRSGTVPSAPATSGLGLGSPAGSPGRGEPAGAGWAGGVFFWRRWLDRRSRPRR